MRLVACFTPQTWRQYDALWPTHTMHMTTTNSLEHDKRSQHQTNNRRITPVPVGTHDSRTQVDTISSMPQSLQAWGGRARAHLPWLPAPACLLRPARRAPSPGNAVGEAVREDGGVLQMTFLSTCNDDMTTPFAFFFLLSFSWFILSRLLMPCAREN